MADNQMVHAWNHAQVCKNIADSDAEFVIELSPSPLVFHWHTPGYKQADRLYQEIQDCAIGWHQF